MFTQKLSSLIGNEREDLRAAIDRRGWMLTPGDFLIQHVSGVVKWKRYLKMMKEVLNRQAVLVVVKLDRLIATQSARMPNL
jgi:hypothetical protein